MLGSPSSEARRLELRPAAGRLDEERIQALVRGLTPRSRYLRFFNGIRELAPAWLERFGRADPHGDFTLLVVARETGSAVGMGQYSADPYPSRADFAVVVTDLWQGLGIGSQLIRTLLSTAHAAGFERIEAEVLAENRPMVDLLRRLGFRLRRSRDRYIAHFSCNAAAAR